MPQLKWSYGVTTVVKRFDDGLLGRTLASLRAAGFDNPRLFVDGARDGDRDWRRWDLDVTFRWPSIRTYGNWALSLAELWIREPNADRYAVFQDDFVTCRNLRAYLDNCPYPAGGYLNLYTFPSNQALAPLGSAGRSLEGFYQSNQFGRGAVALVFDRAAVAALLTHHDMVSKPQAAGWRGWKKVDGVVVTAMKKAGFVEHVHNPSLVQHVGLVSSMGNRQHPQAPTFPGEDFDAITLLKLPPEARTRPASQPASVAASETDGWSRDDWAREVGALRAAIAGDEERLRVSDTTQGRSKLQRVLADYRIKLADAEKRTS